jgi:hypothetical protein
MAAPELERTRCFVLHQSAIKTKRRGEALTGRGDRRKSR